jgi:soluble lytic murein transglycosylase
VETLLPPWGWPSRRDAAGAAVAIALLVAAAPAHASGAPLCDWLSGIGDAAQALAERRAGAAEVAARRALAARPRGAAGARASAALGLALSARSEPREAAAVLEVALAPPTAPARAHLARARGAALLAAGDAPAAARLFGEAARASHLALSGPARLDEAEALLAAGLAAEALPPLEARVGSPDAGPSGRARLALARARRAQGDPAGAVEVLRALWLEADLPEARRAGEALDAWRSAGGPVAPPMAADGLARADRLIATGRPEAALDALAAAADADDGAAAGPRIAAARAVALLALGRFADAEKLAAPLAESEDAAVRRTARWSLARVAARAGRLDDASRWYADVAALAAPVPGLPEWRQRDLADESAFLAAWLYYDAGEFERAIAALERFARANPRSRRAEDALWFAAWSRVRLGRPADAARALAALSRGPLGDAAAYWQGRLDPSPARQRAHYRAALSRGGDGWYGLLARARLEALGERAARPARPAARALPDAADAAASPTLSVAVELLGLGLEDAALDELRALARSPRVRPSAPLVAQLAAFTGDAELPFRIARDHLAPTRRALRWSHPEAFPELLPRRALAFGLDPALLRAIMRRESAFRRDARSGAGAEGLLQLRPATADRAAALLGVPGPVGTRLGDPEVSVSVGAHYLALLRSRFGDPAAAVAAYNAGPRPVAAWAQVRAGMPLDAWVESIPYRETRQYVKIVLSDWDVYRELSGDAAAPVDPLRPVAAPADGVAF